VNIFLKLLLSLLIHQLIISAQSKYFLSVDIKLYNVLANISQTLLQSNFHLSNHCNNTSSSLVNIQYNISATCLFFHAALLIAALNIFASHSHNIHFSIKLLIAAILLLTVKFVVNTLDNQVLLNKAFIHSSICSSILQDFLLFLLILLSISVSISSKSHWNVESLSQVLKLSS
jgi:hypothetical protein